MINSTGSWCSSHRSAPFKKIGFDKYHCVPVLQAVRTQSRIQKLNKQIEIQSLGRFTAPSPPPPFPFGTVAVRSRMQLRICYLIIYLWIYYESLGDVLQCTQDDISREKSFSQAHTPMNTGTQGPS